MFNEDQDLNNIFRRQAQTLAPIAQIAKENNALEEQSYYLKLLTQPGESRTGKKGFGISLITANRTYQSPSRGITSIWQNTVTKRYQNMTSSPYDIGGGVKASLRFARLQFGVFANGVTVRSHLPTCTIATEPSALDMLFDPDSEIITQEVPDAFSQAVQCKTAEDTQQAILGFLSGDEVVSPDFPHKIIRTDFPQEDFRRLEARIV